MKIDKIYIISLNASNQKVQEELVKKLNDLKLETAATYEIVQGFDGRYGAILPGFEPYSGWNLGNASDNKWYQRDITPGEIGCAISHYTIWKRILEDGVNNALILEDDFQGIKPISELKNPSQYWDIISLGRNPLQADKEITLNAQWLQPLNSYNAHAYVLSNSGADLLVNSYDFRNNLIPLDEFLHATYCNHDRPDIVSLFPPKLNALAPIENYIVQKRPHMDSNTEPVGANINLIKELGENYKDNLQVENTTLPYFEILDDSNWDLWKSKYLNHTLAKGEYDLMIDDIGNNIYEFPIFTEKFCKEAIALAETLDKWTQDRHEFYPTNDVLLPEIGLNVIYTRVLKEVVFPICIHLWKLEGTGWPVMFSENFMARYTMDRQSHLSLHHDFSHVTMVVKLNDEFEGGGTWFPKYKTLSNPKKVGTATLHPGMVTHLHGARPITAGKRYICVSFMRKE